VSVQASEQVAMVNQRRYPALKYAITPGDIPSMKRQPFESAISRSDIDPVGNAVQPKTTLRSIARSRADNKLDLSRLRAELKSQNEGDAMKL
jgi:hypothetical protein